MLPQRSIPAPRLRLPAKSSRDERRRIRAHLALSAKVGFADPQPRLEQQAAYLCLSQARTRPSGMAKTKAEEIIRLIMSGTIIPIAHNLVPQERWNQNEIVYYNPVVKQRRNDDGSIQFHVRGTVGRKSTHRPLRRLCPNRKSRHC